MLPSLRAFGYSCQRGRAKPDNQGAAAMQQAAEWLEKLGLGQYAQRFAENDVSFSILPDLTDQDLKAIGVSLGHRRQLLHEIANLDKTAPASLSAPGPPPRRTHRVQTIPASAAK